MSASTFKDPVTIQTPLGGSITVSGLVSGTGDGSLFFDGAATATTLGANLQTEGDTIQVDNSIVLGAGVTIDTTLAGNTDPGPRESPLP